MARLDPVPLDELKAQNEMWAMLEQTYGFVGNALRTMALYPKLARTARELTKTVLYESTHTDPELRWLVGHVASRAAGCRYCSAHSAHFGQQIADVSMEKFEAVWEFETSPLFDEAERSALRVALGAGRTPNEVTEEQFADMRTHYSPEAVVEIVAVISLYGYFNRWNDTMATDLEFEPGFDPLGNLGKST